MTKERKIWIASKFAEKGYDYRDLLDSDYLYELKGEEKEIVADEIWEYVEEYKDYGSIAFEEKYKDYKLYK